MNIKNKVAIVTGASSGIGLATAKLFSKNGANVVLAARSLDKLQKIYAELPNSLVIRTDMVKEKDIIHMVKKTFDHYGRVDVLINNAGQGYDSPVEKINSEIFKKIFALDLLSPVLAMKEVIPIMRKQKSGIIINVSSGTALMFLPNMAPYSSMKRALVGISLTAREELKDDNIHVSVVYPYITLTNFEKNTIKEKVSIREGNWDADLPKFDSADYVAQKILFAAESGEAEVYAHDWMNRNRLGS